MLVREKIEALEMPESSLILDIETTGLSRHDKIMLIGIVASNEHNIKSYQLFDDNGQSEKNILNKLEELIFTFKPANIITFNGGSFDIPFINRRFLQNNMSYQIPKELNKDLFRFAKKKLNIPKHNLKSVEMHLGINRDDTISGQESVLLYNNYLSLCKSASLSSKIDFDNSDTFIPEEAVRIREKILLHNYDDIINLSPLLKLLNGDDYNIKVRAKKYGEIEITGYSLRKDRLFMSLHKYDYNHKPIDVNIHGIRLNLENGRGEISVPCRKYENLIFTIVFDNLPLIFYDKGFDKNVLSQILNKTMDFI